ELYATGLSYRKVGALVGRSAAAVEGLCKHYPPELVAQVCELRRQGLSFATIAGQVGHSKSYIAGLVNTARREGTDWPRERDGDDHLPVPVM
ncbi:MAG: hypothetical protein JXA33_13295, partial [Anaerolineae bacterium]|nr:hypothetical protein [Anaerolineae bacterium]